MQRACKRLEFSVTQAFSEAWLGDVQTSFK